MNISQFKNFLARIKEDFDNKLRNHYSKHLTIEQQVAQLLHRHLNGQPFAQKQLLLKSTGQQHLLTWDDLLQYLQEDIYLQQTVKKIEISALSSTEIIDNHHNKFVRLVQFVKHKETNAIQSIYPLSDSVGHDMFLVCFERKLIVYDLNKCEIIGQLDFKYQLTKVKIMQEQQPKPKINEQINLEKSDEVGPIPRKNRVQKHSRLSHNSVNFLTNNIKSSVRGSSVSSEVSNDRVFLRRFNTDLLDNRNRSKSNLVKIKNDNVHKVFDLFQRASVDNSLAIAQAFTQASNNHQKSIVIDKKVLQKQKIQKPLEFSSAHIRKNFNQDLEIMRKTSKQLDKIAFFGHSEMVSTNQHSSIKTASSKQRYAASRRRSTTFFRPESDQEMSKITPMNGKSLQIVHLSTLQNLVLISFYNCQIRLLVLKHALGRVTEQVIFQCSFNQIVSFVQIYRSQKSHLLHMALALQKSNHTEIVIYCFQKQKKSTSKKFSQKLSFVAKCQGILPLGILLYNECGKFSLLQLNNSMSNCQEQIRLMTELYNKESGYRISISQVRAHRNMTHIYLGCSHGYIYQYQILSKTIKYQTQVSQQSVLDICLIREDSELVCLLANGNMIILSSLHLQQIYTYQSYRYIAPESRLMLVSAENIYVYNARTISCYKLSRNEQKAFSNSKPLKLLKSRLLLKRRQSSHDHLKKGKVIKLIEGVGGNSDFLALLIEHGQVIILGHQLTYIGSYHILKVDNIVDLTCNNYYQFIAVLFEDNSIQVINLYTQNVVFHISNVSDSVDSLVKNKASSALQKFLKTKNQHRASVRMLNFFETEESQFFLAVITKDNFIYHYDIKGTMQLKINLSQRLGDMQLTGPMVFNGEELIFGHSTDLVVLHRKSYLRKYVIVVGDSVLVHLKRSIHDKSIICGVDSLNRLFLIDLQLRKSNYMHFHQDVFKYDILLFNQLMLLKYYEQTCSIQTTDSKKINVSVDNKKYYLTILQNEVIRVSKPTGLLARLDFETAKFKDLAI